MKFNSVKQKIQQGGTAVGTMVFEFNTTGIGRIAAEAGAEFAIFDMEHTGWTLETMRMLFATTRSTSMLPFVRVPATEYHFIARALDVGAMGIMVPMVESEAQARKLAESAKYPPAGRRGAAFGVAHDDYTSGDIVEKIASSNRETLLIAQIETAQGLKNVDAIAAVEGIDVLWIGHFDLTNFLGIPGQFDNPIFLDAVKTVVAACQQHKKVAGFMVGDIPTGRRMLEQGFRILAYSGDLWLYQAALAQGVAALRAHGR
jgi:2-keto-3-deoxy-L-rhamnonate aldolase RhmA